MAWLDEFKLAVANEDSTKMLSLSQNLPANFANIDEAKSALLLTKQAITILKSQKNALGIQLERLKKVEKYTNYFE